MAANNKLFGILEWAEKIIVVVGFPFAIYQYMDATQQEKEDRDYKTYNSLDDKYIEWQHLGLAHPYLDIADTPDSIPPVLTPQQQKEETILFSILASMMERAYILYNKESKGIRKEQWTGWDQYIASYCQRDNFRQYWGANGFGFDTDFLAYMKKKMSEQSSTAD
ncbi:MAG: hypothetical protein KDB99_16440 [Chitinophagaceae bacterium]|nr:hypothetical protein [Chitinophagaceae bacterium]